MDKIKVMMVLHAYQPPYPIQEPFVIERIVDNCYRPIANNLESSEDVKLVINMNASLTEILLDVAPDIIDSFSHSAKEGKVEFLESGAYHPIFPLISKEQVQIQLELNNRINLKAFGSVYQPQGVWPPELAINLETLQLFARNGYSYAIIPENSLLNQTSDSIPYILQNERQFNLINRDKNLSNSISFNVYKGVVNDAVKHFREVTSNKQLPVVIATDMETFGEHNPDYWNFMFDFLSHSDIQSITYDSVEKIQDKKEISDIYNSSWSTEDDDMKNGIAYPLWDHPSNPIHAIQHTHFSILEHIYEKEKGFDNLTDAELKLYLKSTQSCQFWWADKNQGRWSPDIINKGIDLQRKAIVIQNNELSNKLSYGLKQRLDRLLKT